MEHIHAHADLPYTLVVLDIDGTLLNSDHVLTEYTRQTIVAMRKLGVQVVLATGKLFQSIKPLIQNLQLDGPQITCNGAVVADAQSHHFLHTFLMQEKTARDALTLLASVNPDLPIGWYTPANIYTTNINPAFSALLQMYHEPEPLIASSLQSLPDPVKILITGSEEDFGNIRAAAAKDQLFTAQITRTSVDFLEFSEPGVHKGAALQLVADTLQIPKHKIIAIGDGENDISMLQTAGLGVAMANANPEVQKWAKQTTLSNDEDGAAKFLAKIFL